MASSAAARAAVGRAAVEREAARAAARGVVVALAARWAMAGGL